MDHGSVIQPDLAVLERFDALLLAYVIGTVDLFCQSIEMLVLKVTPQGAGPLFRSRIESAQGSVSGAEDTLVGWEEEIGYL